ncbi:tRNA:m(4)X modification enzyme TRM13 homolog [Uloborus diversus]|uniref:tRNA:m(4)X modification enzyme TRM13 homolog n=1 Tax=Uloborus diversus TaxID=327109 RepID=UPI00240978FB|nr:tRNA:m(4)X modification enzyme TRM13 homolog [Uloborus diversus]
MNKRSAPEEAACSFFLERKKRACRMKTVEGMSYCPHHSHLNAEKNDKKGLRIPCPYDSSHFCYQSKLEKHLKKCNAREKEKPEYFVKNINVGDEPKDEVCRVTLKDVSDEELLNLIEKIKTIYAKNCSDIQNFNEVHPILSKEMQDTDDGANSFKHMKQQGSLLEILSKFKLLTDGLCFVEFGAGRGQLMYWIVKCVSEKEKASFILVDKSAQRHKSDNKFKGEDFHIERIRMDIQHLHLGKIPSIKQKLNKVVGVSKHLCGAATDLALNCLTKTLSSDPSEEVTSCQALGLVMALCCYHRCSWSSYVGKQFMRRNDITESDFKLMCCMASWATCGLRKIKNENVDHPTKCSVTNVAEDKVLSRYIKLGLEHNEREEIGSKCKRLIDFGRIEYLKGLGYDSKLLEYIDKSVTLENVVLVAVHDKSL